MTWPWVSRTAMESERKLVAWLREQVEAEREARAAWEVKYRSLAERSLQMRSDGFSPPPMEMAEMESPPDEVLNAIEERSERNTPLRRRLGDYAAKREREGADAGEIAAEILSGTDVMEW